MASFVTSVALAARRAGRALASLARRAGKALKAAGKKVWGYRLKAKDASKAAKDRMTEDMAKLAGRLKSEEKSLVLVLVLVLDDRRSTRGSRDEL